MERVRIVECPRDAMQGWSKFIPTTQKIEYLELLSKVGFHTIDFGSFVSAKAIPQLADTHEVISGINISASASSISASASNISASASNISASASKLLAIVANERGASTAATYPSIEYIGYPFSISETFQLRNTNSTMESSLALVKRIAQICMQANKQLVVYISMAFGNPYGDAYSPQLAFDWIQKIRALKVPVISLADTVGLASPDQVFAMAEYLIAADPGQEYGVHLHSGPDNWKEKLQAALDAGCRRFDGAINGVGGCPMADDILVGNMNTQWMVAYFESQGYQTGLDKEALAAAEQYANTIFVH